VNFIIILESLKFYRLRHERTIQLWFVLLYALNIMIFFLPAVDTDFTAVYKVLEDLSGSQLANTSLETLLTPGNWLYLGLTVAVNALNGFFILMYAALFVGEADSLPPRQSVLKCLAALPRLLLLALLLVIPALISVLFFMIPIIIFGMMMYFLPLNLAISRHSLTEAMHQSFLSTNRQKLFIFIQVMMLSIVISLPRTLILMIIPLTEIPFAILTTFFTVLQVFIQGRLMGILYLFLVKKVPLVITSKPNDQKPL
jgi:hypothetical protein